MKIICEIDEIIVRSLEKSKADMEIMLKWLNSKNVSDFYGDSREYTFEEIKEKYTKKIDSNFETPCIIEYNKKPIGYIQYYIVNQEEYEIPKEIYNNIVKTDEKNIAIDLFIGEDEYRNKGLGTKTIKTLLNEIFNDNSISSVLIDPKTSNKRAIECYRKCGFKDVCVIPNREEKDGIKYDNLIMKIENYNIK